MNEEEKKVEVKKSETKLSEEDLMNKNERLIRGVILGQDIEKEDLKDREVYKTKYWDIEFLRNGIRINDTRFRFGAIIGWKNFKDQVIVIDSNKVKLKFKFPKELKSLILKLEKKD